MPRLHDRPFLAAITLLAALTILATACGGAATQAPGTSQSPGSSDGPAVSDTPTEDPGSSGPAESPPAGGGAAFGSATTALDALDSYSYSVEVEQTLVTGTVTSTQHTQLVGVVHNAPEQSRRLDFRQLDADGALTTGSSILVIGDRAWLAQLTSLDEEPAWQEVPAAQADLFIQGFQAFRPAQAFGTNFGTYALGFQEVGTETKNGVECRHFEGLDTLGSLIAPIAGIEGTWAADAWIAVDGGYLVHSELHGQGTSSGNAATYDVTLDIADFDSAEALTPPS